MRTQKGSGWFNSLISTKSTKTKKNTGNSGNATNKSVASGTARTNLEKKTRQTLTDFFTIITDKRFVPNDFDHFYEAISYAIRIGSKKHTDFIINNYLKKHNSKMPTELIEEMTTYALDHKSPDEIKTSIHQFERLKKRQIKEYGLYHTKKAIPEMKYKLSRF